MCGACGSGRVRAPWEDTVGPRDPGTSRRLAAALTRRLRRWRIAPWPGGYTVAGPQGALAPAGSVDEVVARARDAGVLAVDEVVGTDLDLAEALVRASVLALDGAVVRPGPDPGAPRRLRAHGHVPVDVVPRPGTGWSVG
jgi:hypothetical protein